MTRPRPRPSGAFMVIGTTAIFGAGVCVGYLARPDRAMTTTTSVEPAPRVIFVQEPQTQIDYIETPRGRK